MTTEELPRRSRRKRSRRKSSTRRRRRTVKVIVWSLVGLVALSLFVAGAIYLVLIMRGAGTDLPTTTPVRTG